MAQFGVKKTRTKEQKKTRTKIYGIFGKNLVPKGKEL
jgi:hypothetical protein